MKPFLYILLSVAALTASADSSLTTPTENKALYAATIATTANVGGAFTTTTNATIGGLLLQPTHLITASTTLTTAHQFVIASDIAGDVVLTLPDPATGTNYNLVLMKRFGTNHTTYTSSVLINAIANTMPLPIFEPVTLRSSGSNWFIISGASDTFFTAFTATTTLTVGDTRNSYNDTAGNITVNLPSATNYSTLGRIYWHKKYSGGNTTTLDPAGSETIDGASTLSLGTSGSVAIYSDLSNWRTLSSSGLIGNVTSVSVTAANGVSGTVATATTTPAISLTLGAITPSSVAATGPISGTTLTSTVATGTPPLVVASTTRIPNLNADLIDGLQKVGIQPANANLTNVSNLTVQSLPSTIISATENTQTGTTYTLASSDNGKVVTLNNGSAITVTVPTLSAGFSCTFIQKGAGQVTFSASGTTISNAHSQTKTFGQHAVVTLYGLSSTAFVLAGDTGT
jgi:hypothetical protein